MEDSHLEGVLLVTVLHDLTLAHLLIIIKRNGPVPRFEKLVVGISNLKSVWKGKNDSGLKLRQLEEH